MQCAEIIGEETASIIDWDSIENCANSVDGEHLLASYGDVTPTLTFVPHVMVNGKHLPEDSLDNFKDVLCAEYLGEKPQACLM